jgi:hypothetical protein
MLADASGGVDWYFNGLLGRSPGVWIAILSDLAPCKRKDMAGLVERDIDQVGDSFCLNSRVLPDQINAYWQRSDRVRISHGVAVHLCDAKNIFVPVEVSWPTSEYGGVRFSLLKAL